MAAITTLQANHNTPVDVRRTPEGETQVAFAGGGKLILVGDPHELLVLLERARNALLSDLGVTRAGELDLVLVHDPDSGANAAVFVDGVPTTARTFVIDPGAGGLRSEWDQATAEIDADLSVPVTVRTAVVGLRDLHADSEYLTDD